MKLLALLPLLALAACATTARPSRAWLVGNWCPEDSSTTYAGAAHVSLRPTRFDANRTYRTFDERGRWELHGQLLRLQLWYIHDTLITEGRIERLGPDRMTWTLSAGVRTLWRRCPADRQ